MINITPNTSAVDPDRTGHRVDRGAPEAAEVDHERVIPHPETATMVTTATNGERQHVVARVRHAGKHVGHVGAPHDREWVTIHCAVVDSARRVVFRIGSGDDLASDSGKIIND
jgi:hypothetical protein